MWLERHLAFPLRKWMDVTPDEVEAELIAAYPSKRIQTVEFGGNGALGEITIMSILEFRLLLREYRERDKVAFLVFRKPGTLVAIAKPQGTI